MSELNFTGNCLKGSRPFLSFDANFDQAPHTRVMKEVLSQIFGTPKNHPRSRPFIDHVFSFSLIGDKVWFRNFQVADEVNDATKKIEKTLVEIGPRFVMDPIRILAGGFSGAVLWDNPEYLTPSAERSLQKAEEAKEKLEVERKARKAQKKKGSLVRGPGDLDDVFADSESEEEDGENGMNVDESGSEEGNEEGSEGESYDDESDQGSEEDNEYAMQLDEGDDDEDGSDDEDSEE